MRVAVLGAGAWGTAIAVAAVARNDVTLFARDHGQAQAMRMQRENVRYLPAVALPVELRIESDLTAALEPAPELVVAATPTAGLRGTLRALSAQACFVPLLWLCKGFERDSGKLAHEIAGEENAQVLAGPLSGPSFAIEVAQGRPTALTVAGDAALCELATAVFHTGALRLYATDDVIGVEVGGAVKNVLAIATGIADALGLGLNARAALITRGLAEITRLGVAMGARAETFMGLAGIGDLLLTCTGDLSRNRKIGLLLGRGVPLMEAVSQIGHVAEGVWSAPAVAWRARQAQVEMPITAAVCAVLEGSMSPPEALEQLLAREPKREDEPLPAREDEP